jgi:predicted NUDIX family NTP pyrophosphohydrolase
VQLGAVFTGTGTVTIEDVPTAQLSYAKEVADVANVADYSIEVEWTISAGVTETFPVCDRYIWHVIPDIA